MLTYNPDNNLVGQEPKKEVKPKKFTGILKDLTDLRRCYQNNEGYVVFQFSGEFVRWSDIEEIIKKYS